MSSTPTSTAGCAARVLAVQGSWAFLWFPDTDETVWVDLAEVGFEALPGEPDAPAREV